jgi:hypothetical protein
MIRDSDRKGTEQGEAPEAERELLSHAEWERLEGTREEEEPGPPPRALMKPQLKMAHWILIALVLGALVALILVGLGG